MQYLLFSRANIVYNATNKNGYTNDTNLSFANHCRNDVIGTIVNLRQF